MKLKNILLQGLSLVLVAALAIGGTVAYLTDTDSDVNVMTLGNVSIEQIEQERDADGNLVDFTQGKPALPAVYEGTSIPWADESEWPVSGNQAWKVVEDNENVVDKFVSVKNTGKSDAFVRTIIAFEVGKDKIGDPYMHFVCNDSPATPWDFEWAADADGNGITIEIDGSVYCIGVFTYTDVLKPGVTTVPNVKQVYLDKTATNEICAAYGDTFEILVVSQAVQADGFADANTALDAAFGEITTTNHPWMVELEVDNAAELVEALAANKNVKLTADIDMSNYEFESIEAYSAVLDGNSKSITGLDKALFANLKGAIIENLSIEGTINVNKAAVGILADRINNGGAHISNVTVSGSVTNNNFYTGGMIGAITGKQDTTIVSCVNNAAVSNSRNHAGGLVGTAYGDVTFINCVNNGDVSEAGGYGAGGICGFVTGYNGGVCPTFISCENNGDITGKGRAGGIAGTLGTEGGMGGPYPLTATFESCVNTGAVESENGTAGDICGTPIHYADGKSDGLTVIVK